MEYKNIKSLKDEFIVPEKETERVVLTNPIDKYNFFVNQYNIEYNIVDDTRIANISGDRIYRLGYLIEKRIINYLIIFGVIPGLFLLFKYFVFKKTDLYVILISIYFGLVFMVSLITLIIYLLGRLVYKSNVKKVPNPFKKMIYHPDLCRILNVNNQHIEYKVDDLDRLNLTEIQMNIIVSSRNSEGLVRFMIYDQGMIDYYSAVGKRPIGLARHIFWVISSIGFYILYIFLFLKK